MCDKVWFFFFSIFWHFDHVMCNPNCQCYFSFSQGLLLYTFSRVCLQPLATFSGLVSINGVLIAEKTTNGVYHGQPLQKRFVSIICQFSSPRRSFSVAIYCWMCMYVDVDAIDLTIGCGWHSLNENSSRHFNSLKKKYCFFLCI